MPESLSQSLLESHEIHLKIFILRTLSQKFDKRFYKAAISVFSNATSNDLCLLLESKFKGTFTLKNFPNKTFLWFRY